ncbi:MAG: hypothetical protein J6L05_01785, partial [Ruminococcus sp.]|nr:hypothetical protein [Ruminococcus sp.]
MFIKKILSVLTAGMLLMAPVFLSGNNNTAVELNASAADNNGFSAAEIENSSVKPEITVDTIELELDDAKASPIQRVNISISNAEYKYASTGIHVYWDSRLTVVPDSRGNYATPGSAIRRSSCIIWPNENGFFAATAHAGDYGRDGIMYSFDLMLPNNVFTGDIYPICVVYEENNLCSDLFTNTVNDSDGKLMQAWLFTKGINNGYIVIKENVTTTTTTTATTTTTTTSTTTSSTTTTTTTPTTTTTTTPTTTTTTTTTPTTTTPTTTTTTTTTPTTTTPTT